jgi:tetratricopeptide (TPR) repeat protein
MNNIEEKIETATQKITQNPNSPDAYERRGDLYNGKGDHDSAARDYTKAAELDPGNPKREKKRLDALRNDLNQ